MREGRGSDNNYPAISEFEGLSRPLGTQQVNSFGTRVIVILQPDFEMCFDIRIHPLFSLKQNVISIWIFKNHEYAFILRGHHRLSIWITHVW